MTLTFPHQRNPPDERLAYGFDGVILPISEAVESIRESRRSYHYVEWNAMFNVMYLMLSDKVGGVAHHINLHLMPFLSPEMTFGSLWRYKAKHRFDQEFLEEMMLSHRLLQIDGYAAHKMRAQNAYDGVNGECGDSEISFVDNEGDERDDEDDDFL